MEEKQAKYGASYVASAPKADEPENVRYFRNVAGDLVDLYKRKNEAYGDSFGRSVEKYGPISALTRISDKFNRLESLILGAGNHVPDESIFDTLLDLAAYGIMTYMALRDMTIPPVDFENVD